MKRLFTLAILITLASCKSGYYQIYKTASPDQPSVYENEDCRVTYDFWAHGGNPGFTVYNKTDEPLTVYLDRSFFILNGNAHDYYQARNFTSSSTSSSASGINLRYFYGVSTTSVSNITSNNGVEYVEKAQVIIPAKSSKTFNEFRLNTAYLSHCDLPKFPTRKQAKSITFDQANSPVVFSNSITYQSSGLPETMRHEFYVSEIMNVSGTEAVRNVRVDRCKSKAIIREAVHKSPSNFYITYGN